MLRDFYRLKRRKSRRHRLAGLLLLCLSVAVLLVMMRACSDQFSGPYDTGYHPMDMQRKQGNNL